MQSERGFARGGGFDGELLDLDLVAERRQTVGDEVGGTSIVIAWRGADADRLGELGDVFEDAGAVRGERRRGRRRRDGGGGRDLGRRRRGGRVVLGAGDEEQREREEERGRGEEGGSITSQRRGPPLSLERRRSVQLGPEGVRSSGWPRQTLGGGCDPMTRPGRMKRK